MSIDDEVRETMRARVERIEASPDAWERISAGKPELHRSTRSRVLAGLVAAAVALGGFAFVVVAFGLTTSPPTPLAAPQPWSETFGFASSPGWYHVATAASAPESTANVAWASTIPFDQADLDLARAHDGVLGIWTEAEGTMAALSGDDALIAVSVTTNGERYPAQTNVNYPAATSVELPGDPVFETAWEGHRDSGISRVAFGVLVDGWGVEVHAYFGSDDPSPQVLDAVNAQLAGLVLPTPSSASDDRISAYEALIRYLADRNLSGSIYVSADLCSMLAHTPGPACSDRLTHAEQRELAARLEDLGKVIFQTDTDGRRNRLPQILLGPIIEESDGLRIEGGSVCGGLCGSGAMYKLEPTDMGYRVAGKDLSYGTWIS
jgi:hypothetical protein